MTKNTQANASATAALHEGSDPTPVRFLNAKGEWDPSESAAEFAPALENIGVEDLKKWYTDMVVTRAFDRECTNLQRQGQMALWVPSVGQEGCQVGFAHAASAEDYIFPAYREHTVARVRGVDLIEVGRLFRGTHNSGWDPRDPKNGNTHPYTLVLGAQVQHAVGHSLGQLLDAKAAAGQNAMDPGEAGTPTGKATLVFYGDGTTSQGDANEGMIFAASYQTPTLFLVQNNQWAISVPVTRQSRTPLYRRALGFGIPAVQIDGNDPLAAYAVAHTYLDAARNGGGPRYIEALTYRIGAHTTSDDPTRYRKDGELEYWQAHCPIARLAAYLRAQGVAEEFFAEVDAAAATEANRVREGLLATSGSHPDSMFAHVYAEDHPLIDEQRRWMAAYEASFEENNA